MNNTIDIQDLLSLGCEVDRSGGPSDPATALFLGTLAASKGLDLLVASGDILAMQVPGFKLIVGGSGPDAKWLEERAASRPWIELYGPVTTPSEKVALARRSSCLLIPKGVGLVAVDSFALGLPIVTTLEGHGPEVEYLVDHVTARLIASDDPEEYAAAALQLLTDQEFRREMAGQCLERAGNYSMSRMVEAFADGIQSSLQSDEVGCK